MLGVAGKDPTGTNLSAGLLFELFQQHLVVEQPGKRVVQTDNKKLLMLGDHADDLAACTQCVHPYSDPEQCELGLQGHLLKKSLMALSSQRSVIS